MMPMAIHYVHIHICRAMHRRRYKNFHITKHWKWNENFTDFLWAPACCAASAPFSKRKGFSAAERAQKQREGRASASTQLENWNFFSKFSSDLDDQLQLRPLKSYVNPGYVRVCMKYIAEIESRINISRPTYIHISRRLAGIGWDSPLYIHVYQQLYVLFSFHTQE